MRAAFLAAVVACAHPPPRIADVPADLPPSSERHYTVWLGGVRVGTAVDTEQWSRDGVVLRRAETMRFLRGDAPVALTTTIEITADRALVPSRVVWSERGQVERHGGATRGARGWIVDGVGRELAAGAVPGELVPLIVRRDGRFDGRVFLPARAFVSGHGRVEPVAPHRLVARLALDGGAIAEATIDVGEDGAYARVVDGDGVIAIRTTAAQAGLPFELGDLIAATAIPIAGHPRAGERRIVLDGDLALPPVPGQSASGEDHGIELRLSSRLRGGLPAQEAGADRTREIRALVAQVRARIAPDLGAGPGSAAATAGDCTTYALAYAAYATRRAIPTRLVTGLRIDGERLVRHRWAVSWTGVAWIAIDAAFGVAPAGGDLIGLAVHDADDAGLVAGEAALTQVRGASWR